MVKGPTPPGMYVPLAVVAARAALLTMISIKSISIVVTAAICVAVAVPFSAGLVLRLGVTAGNWLRGAELA